MADNKFNSYLTQKVNEDISVISLEKNIQLHTKYLLGKVGGKILNISFRQIHMASFAYKDLRGANFTGSVLIDCVRT